MVPAKTKPLTHWQPDLGYTDLVEASPNAPTRSRITSANLAQTSIESEEVGVIPSLYLLRIYDIHHFCSTGFIPFHMAATPPVRSS